MVVVVAAAVPGLVLELVFPVFSVEACLDENEMGGNGIGGGNW